MQTSVQQISELLQFLESEDEEENHHQQTQAIVGTTEEDTKNDHNNNNNNDNVNRMDILMNRRNRESELMSRIDLPQRPKRQKRRRNPNENKSDNDNNNNNNSDSNNNIDDNNDNEIETESVEKKEDTHLFKRPDRKIQYEYLDHTADIQLHSWGTTMKEAFEQIGIAMFAYMTELHTVAYKKSFQIECTGYDFDSLLYQFLNELLVAFSCEDYLLFRDVEIIEFDRSALKITAIGYGEHMDLNKHPQGTEIKAITYSAMHIEETDEKTDLYVVLDI